MERIINDLLACGEVQPEPLLGITVLTTAEQAAEDVWGLRVESVSPDGAGEKAGVRAGDFLLTADGQELRSSQDLLRVRRQHYVGDEMTVTLWRNGETMDVTLVLTDAVEESVTAP
jgi:serine protease Do